jgi:site-specific DNA recombinase
LKKPRCGREMLPVALYLRMSDGKQETSIADQRSACQKHAKTHGFRIICEYLDLAISGDATEKRTEFRRMIADSASGKFCGVLCWDQDRFGRFDPLEAGYWIQPLRMAGVWLETVSQGRINWDDFAGRIVYSVQQEAKHGYLRDLSRNVNRGMLSAARQGLWMSAPPFGYRLENRIALLVEDSARVVQEIFRLCLAGLSCREIALQLNDAGVRSMRGGQWSRTTVYQALTNEQYTGDYRWNATSSGKYSATVAGTVVPIQGRKKAITKSPDDVIVIENHHPAIVSRSDFRAVQNRLKSARRMTFARSGPRAFALSGLLFCGSCGSPMHGRHRGRDKLRYYICSRSIHSSDCKPHACLESTVLRFVLAKIADHFSDAKTIELVIARYRQRTESESSAAAIESARSKLSALAAKRKQLETRLTECDIEFLPVVQDSLRRVYFEVAELESQIAELEASRQSGSRTVRDFHQLAADARLLIAGIDDYDPAEMRLEIAKIIGRVTLHSSVDPRHLSRFVLDSAEITLKSGEPLP